MCGGAHAVGTPYLWGPKLPRDGVSHRRAASSQRDPIGGFVIRSTPRSVSSSGHASSDTHPGSPSAWRASPHRVLCFGCWRRRACCDADTLSTQTTLARPDGWCPTYSEPMRRRTAAAEQGDGADCDVWRSQLRRRRMGHGLHAARLRHRWEDSRATRVFTGPENARDRTWLRAWQPGRSQATRRCPRAAPIHE